MIFIHHATPDGRLYTDAKEHFYIDAELLREKAAAVKTAAILDRIARIFGYNSFGALSTYARCRGVTEDVLISWILSGHIMNLAKLEANT